MYYNFVEISIYYLYIEFCKKRLLIWLAHVLQLASFCATDNFLISETIHYRIVKCRNLDAECVTYFYKYISFIPHMSVW